MALSDLFQKLDATLNNLQSNSSSMFSSWNSTVSSLASKLFTKNVPGGQQGPPSPPSSNAGRKILDFFTQGTLTEKAATAGGFFKAAGMHGIGDTFAKAAMYGDAAKGDPEAMLGVLKNLTTHLGKAASHVGQAAFTPNMKAEKLASHAFGAVGDIGAALGPAGLPLQIFGKLGKVVSDSVDKLRVWNEELYKSNTQFAQFSAAMAGVEARQTARDILYSKDRGDSRAATAEMQAQSKHELNQRLAPIEDLAANTGNLISTAFNKTLTAFWDTSPMGALINYLADKFKSAPDTQLGDTEENINDIVELYQNYGAPARFKKP